MSTTQTVEVAETTDQFLFTCLSCSIAFPTAEDQRVHYRSDHHRYNMKRRVAGLPPVSATVFNQKVLDRKAETAVMASASGSVCEVCNKTYTTENAYRSHINSKKHRENELKAAARARAQSQSASEEKAPDAPAPVLEEPTTSIEPQVEPAPAPSLAPIVEVPSSSQGAALTVDDDADEEAITQTIDAKIAAARSRLSPTQCLFCPVSSTTLDDNLTHMSSAHSFFIPDAEYLVDLPGLLTYLGEKIAVGNVCIYCNGRGREFRTLDAVRKHMLDKGHCKIAYDEEEDRLEVSDYYDFSSSYPDAEKRRAAKERRAAKQAAKLEQDEQWEEVDDDGSADEVVEDSASEDSSDEGTSDEDEEVPDNEITYGDSHLELVLPSGARIGHRSMRRYYAQSFPGVPRGGKPEDPNSGRALVRRLLADKNSALVPRKGGFGAFGQGTDVVKARNRGEARNAGRHIREHRDQRKREDFKTKVGFIHNSQKHYRDPLLQ